MRYFNIRVCILSMHECQIWRMKNHTIATRWLVNGRKYSDVVDENVISTRNCGWYIDTINSKRGSNFRGYVVWFEWGFEGQKAISSWLRYGTSSATIYIWHYMWFCLLICLQVFGVSFVVVYSSSSWHGKYCSNEIQSSVLWGSSLHK